MAKTLAQIQQMTTNKYDQREIINELLDYLEANQGGGGGGGGVQSVTGDLVDNSDAENPVVGLPYKVFTALIAEKAPYSQTGGDQGDLIIGETYTITSYSDGDDFSNIADVQDGDINTTGCVFIATGTTATNWTNASQLDSSGIPILTVLRNTLNDTPTATRQSTGAYFLDFNISFNNYKTIFTGQTIIDPAFVNVPLQEIYSYADGSEVGYFLFTATGNSIEMDFWDETFTSEDLGNIIEPDQRILLEMIVYP